MKKLARSPFVVAVLMAWMTWITVAQIAPFAAHPIPQEISHQKGRDDQKKQTTEVISPIAGIATFLEDHNGLLTALATIAIACFTFALNRATNRLWETGKRQNKSSLKAAAAAAEAAKAAGKAADIAERGLTDLERAYIFVKVTPSVPDSTAFIRVQGATQVFKANIQIQNLGKTPAVIRKLRGYFMMADVAPTELIASPIVHQEIPNGLAIGSESTVIDAPEIYLEEGQRSALLNQETGLWVCGEVAYEDIFGNLHITGFCWACRTVGEVAYTIHPSPLNRRVSLGRDKVNAA